MMKKKKKTVTARHKNTAATHTKLYKRANIKHAFMCVVRGCLILIRHIIKFLKHRIYRVLYTNIHIFTKMAIIISSMSMRCAKLIMKCSDTLVFPLVILNYINDVTSLAQCTVYTKYFHAHTSLTIF